MFYDMVPSDILYTGIYCCRTGIRQISYLERMDFDVAISKMKRVSVITEAENADKLMAEFQKLRCFEVTSFPLEDVPPDKDLDEVTGPLPQASADEAILTEVRGDLDRTDKELLPDITSYLPPGAKEADVLPEAELNEEFLENYYPGKRRAFPVPEERLLDAETERIEEYAALCEIVSDMRASLQKCRDRLIEIRADMQNLEIWKGVPAELPQHTTENTVLVFGAFPSKVKVKAIDSALEPYAAGYELVKRNKYHTYSVICSHASDFQGVMRAAYLLGFVKCPVSAEEKDGYAAGRIKMLKAEAAAAEEEIKRIEREAAELSVKGSGMLKVYVDLLRTLNMRHEAEKSISLCCGMAMISGWVPEEKADAVTKLAEDCGAAYEFSDPSVDDEVPVLLSNKVGASMEGVVSMYSLPKYKSFDPTSIMSVFYVLIFGLMFADIGYGLVTLFGSIIALKVLKVRGSLKQFFSMFAVCGISSAVFGALFGGFFGDLPAVILKTFFNVENVPDFALYFSVTDNPVKFLIICLAVGALHMVCGMIIKFIMLVREKRIFDAVCDVGSWLILFSGIGVYFLSSIAGISLIAAGLIMLICTQGRHEKNIFMKAVKGVGSLYNIISYASDLLSYSRILALCLASAVIAQAVNLLGTMGGGGAVGIILMIIIMLVGHTLNFALNILGTYVHTGRLQYIEFFGKFYEDGGVEFNPVVPSSKYVIFK